MFRMPTLQRASTTGAAVAAARATAHVATAAAHVGHARHAWDVLAAGVLPKMDQNGSTSSGKKHLPTSFLQLFGSFHVYFFMCKGQGTVEPSEGGKNIVG